MPLTVLWAGKTPVITLDDLKLPGLGTFSARVLFHKNHYVGSWQHGEVSGHMFGHLDSDAADRLPPQRTSPE